MSFNGKTIAVTGAFGILGTAVVQLRQSFAAFGIDNGPWHTGTNVGTALKRMGLVGADYFGRSTATVETQRPKVRAAP